MDAPVITDLPAASSVEHALITALSEVAGAGASAHGVTAAGAKCPSYEASAIAFQLRLPLSENSVLLAADKLREAGATDIEVQGHGISGLVHASIHLLRFEFTDDELELVSRRYRRRESELDRFKRKPGPAPHIRHCANCGSVIPSTRSRRARSCSDKCATDIQAAAGRARRRSDTGTFTEDQVVTHSV